MPIHNYISLRYLNSWRVGGKAKFFCEPNSIAALIANLKLAKEKKIPSVVLAGGTNVLISDNDFDGLVVSLRSLSGCKSFERDNELKIEAMAGVLKSEVLKLFRSNCLAPAIFLSGIPGSVGGGVVMNAGAGDKDESPASFADITEWVEVLDSNTFGVNRFNASELKWDYRVSSGWQPGIIVQVGLRWPLAKVDNLEAQIAQALQRRKETQPLELPNCGSVFKNPAGHSAGALIESCGLKGLAIGGAKVSEKHANFIVNVGKATARDIYELILHVQKTVYEQKNIKLETEIRFIGEF